ncbi:MAG: hypothetical protein ACYTEQ_29895, partial [Planctomycetota bacterium]
MLRPVFLRACLSALVLCVLLPPRCTVADEGLVAWWRFDEQRGSAVPDSVGQLNDEIKGNFSYVR